MKLAGIKETYTEKGKLKSITINPTVKSELVQDLVDTILFEAHKNEEMYDWEDVKSEIKRLHKANK